MPGGFDAPAFLTARLTVEVSFSRRTSAAAAAAGGFINCFVFVPATSVVAAEGATDGTAVPAGCDATEGAGGAADAVALAAEAVAAVEAVVAEVTVVGSVVAEVRVRSVLSVAVVPVCVVSDVASVLVPVAEVSGVASDDDGFCWLDGLRPLPSERVCMGMLAAKLTVDGLEILENYLL